MFPMTLGTTSSVKDAGCVSSGARLFAVKMLAALSAIVCAIVAVTYYVMPSGSLPIFMADYNVHMPPPSQRPLFFVDRPVCDAMNFSPVAPRLSGAVLCSTNYLWITGPHSGTFAICVT
jgi:hypothetical protein